MNILVTGASPGGNQTEAFFNPRFEKLESECTAKVKKVSIKIKI